MECDVLEYVNGFFILQSPSGMQRGVVPERIKRIQFNTSSTTALTSSDGVTRPPLQTPSPTSVPATTQQRTPAPKNTQLKLASNWHLRLGKGSLAHKDIAHLLSRCGTPNIDLEGKNITIWNQITYLMPLNEARKLLKLGISSRNSLSCPAFPPGCFYYYDFVGKYEEGCSHLYIITDYADQIVGIQLQDNSSHDSRWFDYYADTYSTEWNQFNFINNRKKGNPDWQIGFYVCKGNQTILGHPPVHGTAGANSGVVRIDSDLFSITRDRWGMARDTRSRERNRLLLAQPIVDLMLYVVQQSK